MNATRSFAPLLVAAALAAAACAPQAPATGGSAAPAATPGPARGGTLVVAAGSDPGQLNTAITTAGGTHFVAALLYNGLIFLDSDVTPKPDLAERWSIAPDGKSYTFTLRQNVKWHDGKPFTSADVKFSFEEVLLKYHGRTATMRNVLEGIDAPDPQTVIFRFRQPYGPLLQRLDVIEAPIVAKHIYEGSDPTRNPANTQPVGTGPFKFAEYVRDDRTRFVRNPEYFKANLPYLDEVIFRVIPQANTQVLALENGEVDYLNGVPGPDLPRLQANRDLTLAKSGMGSGGSFCTSTLIFNLERPATGKVEVRQALAYAIDRAQILEQVNFGQGRVNEAFINSGLTWATNPNAPKYPLNRELAGQLLDRAGYPRGADGVRLSLDFVHNSAQARLGELLRQQLQPLGVNLVLKALEVNAANEQTFIRRDFDIGWASYCNGPDPEVGVRRMIDSTNIGPVLFSNGAAYRNPQVDELLNRAAALTDREERGKLYRDLQVILARDLPYLGLTESEGYRAWRSSFQGFQYWSGLFAETAYQVKR
jgi:peptide/nickel transport system substrate-binding protein